MGKKGKPLFDNLRYCTRCCLPETVEGISFDEMGICTVCRSSEQKMHIDWTERHKKLEILLKRFKDRPGSSYDCIVPISGGKDSVFQLHIITKVYGLKPLTVTFNHNWYTRTGRYNLENALEKFDVDHIMYTPKRSLVNRLARKSLYKIGDACWHCHAGVGAFPLQAAVKFNVPLLIWGESVAEVSGRATYYEPVEYDADYFIRMSAKVKPEGMTGDDISGRELCFFMTPAPEEIKKAGIVGIHLGDYIFWDHERQVDFIKKEYGWKEDNVQGTYKKYKSVECIMAGVHDYAKFVKRGFGRTTDHVTQDIRAGLMTREEGFDIIRKIDPREPKALKKYLEITGLSKKEFMGVCKSLRGGKAKDLP
ncbi:MAG: N-acetyl sugar amidotransferase [Candidatus Omnitrophota bacterium]